MKAEEYLKRAATAERRVDAAIKKVELYKAMAEKVTSSLGGDQVTHSRDVTSNEIAILHLIEAQERVKQLQAEYQSIVNEIVNLLAKLNEHDLENVLTYYYLNHHSISDIAAMMHISRPWVYKYQKQGLSEVDVLLAKSDTELDKS